MKSHTAPVRPAARFARNLLATALFLFLGIAARAGTVAAPAADGMDLEKKLESIMLPKIELFNAQIGIVVQYLQQRSIELDPAKKGVNIVLKLGAKPADQVPLITFNAREISLLEALKAVTQLTGLGYRLDGNMVFIEPE